jgi:competence protein ComEC
VPKKRRGCLATVLFTLVAAASLVYYNFKPPDRQRVPAPSGKELQVTLLDVGQGDSLLINSPTGKTALVDAGDNGSGKAILSALNDRGAEKVDLLLATHAHADHIGGADEVINRINVRMVLDNGVAPEGRIFADVNRRAVPTTRSYEDFLNAIEKSGASYIKASPGQTFDLGGGAVISIIAPIQPLFTREQLGSGGNEPNANSIVARLDYGSFSMMLMGDAESQTERRILERGANVGAKIIKIGHHGSGDASTEDFLQVVNPEVAIISVGNENRYGHPNQAVLNRLRKVGAKVYRTDLHGEITITSRGESYSIRTERNANLQEIWTGRRPERSDSSKSGFVAYGDFSTPKESRKKKRDAE